MSVAIAMPVNLIDDHRARAWEWVTDRLVGDGWPVLSTGHGIEPWCKAAAVRAAVDEAAEWDHRDPIIVMHDADVVVDLADLRLAICAVEDGTAKWAVPHLHVKRLTEHATEMVYEGMPLATPELLRAPYIGVAGGGVVVLRMSTYLDVPLDARFLGWGEEDQSWGWALETLHGPPWRGQSDLWHLWHPASVESRNGRSARMASNQLRRAYRAYRGDPERMREVVNGAR